jgi:anti-sigma regulatory factor (Ser/Thr protein kinase)
VSFTIGSSRRGFDHPALLYRDSDEYLAGTLPFIAAAMAAGHAVMVAVPGANLDLIRGGLGSAAADITMHDMTMAGRNPGRIIPGVLLRFADAHAGKPVSIIGEPIWPGRDVLEYPACVQHEALINAVFQDRDAAVLCPYDTTRLSKAALADAYRTHPVVERFGSRWDSPHYADPYALAAEFNVPLPDPPGDAVWLVLDGIPLVVVRRAVDQFATAAGLGPDRTADLVLAANELASNTMTHGGGHGVLSLWTEDCHVVCQVVDGGHIDDPLAGRVPPGRDDYSPSGRGLLLVNQLCDLVRVHTMPGATTIRLHVCR